MRSSADTGVWGQKGDGKKKVALGNYITIRRNPYNLGRMMIGKMEGRPYVLFEKLYPLFSSGNYGFWGVSRLDSRLAQSFPNTVPLLRKAMCFFGPCRWTRATRGILIPTCGNGA